MITAKGSVARQTNVNDEFLSLRRSSLDLEIDRQLSDMTDNNQENKASINRIQTLRLRDILKAKGRLPSAR